MKNWGLDAGGLGVGSTLTAMIATWAGEPWWALAGVVVVLAMSTVATLLIMRRREAHDKTLLEGAQQVYRAGGDGAATITALAAHKHGMATSPPPGSTRPAEQRSRWSWRASRLK